MKNGTTRSSQNKGECKRSELSSKTEGVGNVSTLSGKSRANPLGIGRENSHRGDSSQSGKCQDTSINGKVINQLVDQLQRELAYHRDQVSHIENRLEELQQLSGELKEITDTE